MSSPKAGPASDVFRSTMVGVMMNLMRTSSLASKVDISSMTQFVSDNWDRLFQDGVLDLGPIHDVLMATGQVQGSEAAGVMLFLKKREAKLGVTVKLPLAVSRLPEATREKLLDTMMATGLQSGVTMVGMQRIKAASPPAEAPKAAPAHAAAGLTDRVREILSSRKDKKDG